MDTEKMGRFICALRRERGLTQKTLAGRLQITDKAVSKWERGLSCPDITLLPALAQALGVTVGELLAGAREPVAAGPGRTAAARKSSPQPLRKRCAVGWMLFLLAGVLVCGICDLCTGGRGWALYPALGCLLTGAVTVWLVLWGAKGIFAALLCFSGLIGPFLCALDRLIAGPVSILPVGLMMAALGLALLWCCFGAVLHWRARPLRAGAVCAGLCIAACLAADLLLARQLNTPPLDGWDLFAVLLLGTLAAALLWLDRRAQASNSEQPARPPL